jgi:Tol biopolymer transport system component
MIKRRSAAVAVVSSVAMAALACIGLRPAEAAFPGHEGLVAYVLTSNSHVDIWTINPTNGVKKKLTSQGRNSWPRWSADGKHIAYSSSGDLWVMNADGTGKRDVTTTGKDLKPAWSPDGKQLVFIRLQANGHGDLFRTPLTGGTVTRLTNDALTGGDDRPTWSPRGTQILFEHVSSSGTSIKYVPATGGTQHVVPAAQATSNLDAGSQPDWAPDGQNVLFLASCDKDAGCLASYNVYKSTLTGSTRTSLTDYDGFDEDDSLFDYAAPPDAKLLRGQFNFAAIAGEGYNIATQQFAFVGLDVYSHGFGAEAKVAGAAHPDWQPVPRA